MKLKRMDLTKKEWLKLFLIAATATIFRLILQVFMPDTGSTPLPPSIIVKSGLMPIAFTVFGLLVYGLLAVVFVLIRDGLPGKRMMKGLRFGLAFGLMWVVYLFEPLPFNSGTPLMDMLAYPLADGVALFVLGLLLGRFMVRDSAEPGKKGKGPAIMPLAVIPVLFMVARYVGYTVIHIDSDYTARPLETMAWVCATGLWVGVMYFLLRPGIAVKSPLVKAGYFGLLVFGIDLFLFNFFIPLVFVVNIADMFIRAAIDIVAVMAGVYVYERISVAREC